MSLTQSSYLPEIIRHYRQGNSYTRNALCVEPIEHDACCAEPRTYRPILNQATTSARS